MGRILVTGGRGVLGSALIPRLIAAGHTVRSASRSLPGREADTRVEWMRADLATGEGLTEAVEGIDTMIHAASAGLGDSYATDVEGTQRLLDAAKAAGVKHLIYVSIVGIDQSEFKYYKHKFEAEKRIEAAGIPYSILRAPQFHYLINIILKRLTKYPIAFVDPSWKLQPIDVSEVAERLVEMVEAGPSGRVPDIGGPEIRMMGDLTHTWLAARGLKRLIIPIPFPGSLWASFRRGVTTVPDNPYGKITWEQWLAAEYGGQSTIRARQAQGGSRA